MIKFHEKIWILMTVVVFISFLILKKKFKFNHKNLHFPHILHLKKWRFVIRLYLTKDIYYKPLDI